MTVSVDIMISSSQWEDVLEDPRRICKHAVDAALAVAHDPGEGEVSLLLCDDAEISALNARFRNIDQPTNVLAFPASENAFPIAQALRPIGDIALAAETVIREAREQGKTFSDHVSHLVIHGFLHLLGMDHTSDSEAEEMEALEILALGRIGIGDPYAMALIKDHERTSV